jgi:hypothetical protein
MGRIESQVADQTILAKQVLSSIVHAKRSITASDLRIALGIETGECRFDGDN